MINFVNSYFEKNLNIIPVNGKRPYVNDWYNLDFSERIGYYNWKGIGLKCGKASGIICLDFDSTDEDIKKSIQQLLPPILCGKVGNRRKLPSIFFSFNGEDSRDLGAIQVQLLSTGKQTVIPPSPHPNFDKPFEWINKSLLEIDIDDLPDVDHVWKALVELNDRISSDISYSGAINNSRGAIGANKNCIGRNDTLKSQVVAGLTKGLGIDQLVKEILEYDKRHHGDSMTPLFEDQSEPYMNKTPYENALAFVCRIMSSLHRNKNVSIPQSDVVVVDLSGESKGSGKNDNDSDEKEKIKKYRKLPRLIGIGNDIFKDLYSNSPIPRSQFCFMNTMALLSILVGNKALYLGTGLNLYMYGVAPSAFGKDFSFRRVQRILTEVNLGDLLGTSSFTSESSILKFLELKPLNVMGCFVNEAEKVLKIMASEKNNFGTIETLTDLYDGPGKFHVGKGTIGANGNLKEFGKIFSPWLSIVLLSTDTAFQKYANKSMFDTGLLSRFDIFFEDRKKNPRFLSDYNPPVPKGLIERILKLYGVGNNNPTGLVKNPELKFYIPYIKETNTALNLRKEIHETENNKNEDSFFSGMTGRKIARMHKYAALHHYMKHETDFLKTELSVESINWGYECADAIINNMLMNLGSNVASSQYEHLGNRIVRYLKKRKFEKRKTTKQDISNAIRDVPVNSRNAVLIDLIERGEIFKDKNNFYRVV